MVTKANRPTVDNYYLLWGQCSFCKDAFDVEARIVFVPSLSEEGAREGRYRASYVDVRDSRVRVERSSDGRITLLHTSDHKPFIVWSARSMASRSLRERREDIHEEEEEATRRFAA